MGSARRRTRRTGARDTEEQSQGMTSIQHATTGSSGHPAPGARWRECTDRCRAEIPPWIFCKAMFLVIVTLLLHVYVPIVVIPKYINSGRNTTEEPESAELSVIRYTTAAIGIGVDLCMAMMRFVMFLPFYLGALAHILPVILDLAIVNCVGKICNVAKLAMLDNFPLFASCIQAS